MYMSKMCMCVYVCMYIYVCIGMQVYVCPCAYVCIFIYVYICMSVCPHSCASKVHGHACTLGALPHIEHALVAPPSGNHQ